MDRLFAWISSLQNQFIYFAMCLSIPSIVLYLAEIVTIVRHQKFHTSFYALFVARAVADLLYTLDSYYGYRLPSLFGRSLLPVFERLPNICFSAFSFLTNFSFQADNLATICILANRLTAIALPWKQEKLWAKCLPFVLLLIFGVPLVASFQYLLMDFVLVPVLDANNATASFYINFKNPSDGAHVTVTMTLVSVVFLVVCTLVNLLTLAAYRRMAKKASSSKSGECAIQRKLLIYATATFVGHMLIALLMIGQWWFGSVRGDLGALELLLSQYPWIMDLGTVAMSSWLLLWGSDSFRQQFAADLFPEKWVRRFGGGTTASGQQQANGAAPATTILVQRTSNTTAKLTNG